MEELLSVSNLSVSFGSKTREIKAVTGMNLRVKKGQIVALVGESGSGKTVTALSITRLLPYPFAWHPKGSIKINGREIMNSSETKMRTLRGNHVSMIFQEPLNSLNPLHSVEKQIKEVIQHHNNVSDRDAKEKVIEMLGLVGIPEAVSRLHALPHEFSGGQQQQLAIGRALSISPKLLILDEPTEGIQPNIVHEIGDIIIRLNQEGLTILLVEQKLPFARRVAQNFCILDKGRDVATDAMENLGEDVINRYLKV